MSTGTTVRRRRQSLAQYTQFAIDREATKVASLDEIAKALTQFKPKENASKKEKARYEELVLLHKKLELQEGLPHLYGKKMYVWQREFFESVNRQQFLCSANQVGKANPVDSEIPTPSGFVRLGDIKIGDYVFGRDGKPALVLDIPYLGTEDTYLIEFSDGDSVRASGKHLWICKSPRERFRKKYRVGAGPRKGVSFPNETYGKWIVRSTEDIFKHSYKTKVSPGGKYTLPYCEAVEYSRKELFDPYFLGIYLGNGSENSISLNNSDTDIAQTCLKYGNKYNSERLVISVLGENKKKLFTLGVIQPSYLKKIPKEYMISSIEQRRDLLAGLLDTDGYTDRGVVEFCSTSEILAKQVKELVSSLGGCAQIKIKEKPHYIKENGERVYCRKAYRVYIWTKFNPFKAKRKSDKWLYKDRYAHEKVIDKITYVGKEKVKCLSVSSIDESFLIGREYIVTHNSSIQIRKMINVATDPSLWPKYWPQMQRGQIPNQFWYLYPNSETTAIEFETKWIAEWLPRGKFKDHPQYGWEIIIQSGIPVKVVFKTGVTIFFKQYSQKAMDLQSGTVYWVACDEELPYDEFYPELSARLNASDGIFSMVFTATLGQIIWERVIQPKTKSDEVFPEAFKRQVSLLQCTEYEDGSASPWTEEKIKRAIARCGTQSEVDKRIHGKFVRTEGLRFQSFDRTRNVCKPHQIPSTWSFFSGVDIGSGGAKNSPTAIVVIAVNPEFTKARVVRTWRGDFTNTATTDAFQKYREVRGNLRVTLQRYDPESRDFGLIAARNGEPFSMANKDRETGINLLNSLFKAGILQIFEGETENDKLITEISTYPDEITKRNQKSFQFKDDLSDATRYCCMDLPWDFSVEMPVLDLKKDYLEPIIVEETENDRRRRAALGQNPNKSDDTLEEIDFWNDLLEP